MDAAAIPEEKQPHMEWVRSDPAGQPRVGVRSFSVASGRKLRLRHVNGSDSMSTSDSKSPMAVIGEASAGATTRTGDKLLDDATEAFASGSPAKVEVPARLRVIRWLDRYMDPLLVFLALATVPLLIAETAHLGPHDRHVILVANWVIYAAFAVNFALRLPPPHPLTRPPGGPGARRRKEPRSAGSTNPRAPIDNSPPECKRLHKASGAKHGPDRRRAR